MMRRLMIWAMSRFSAFDPATVERWKREEAAAWRSVEEIRRQPNAAEYALLHERIDRDGGRNGPGA